MLKEPTSCSGAQASREWRAVDVSLFCKLYGRQRPQKENELSTGQTKAMLRDDWHREPKEAFDLDTYGS